jgi:hypothetical protein
VSTPPVTMLSTPFGSPAASKASAKPTKFSVDSGAGLMMTEQ